MMTIKKALTISCAILSTSLTSACVHQYNGAEQSLTHQEAYPIDVAEDTATLELAVNQGQRRMTGSDRIDLAAFVSAYKQKGHGQIKVAVPTSTANATSASRVAKNVVANIVDDGISSGYVTKTSYPASAGDSAAPIIVSFAHYSATVTKCGTWDKNMARSSRNTSWENFGCASQNNLAAMLEDPHDLVAPRNMTGADTDRRSTVLERYRSGEPTATVRTTEESGEVSDIQ